MSPNDDRWRLQVCTAVMHYGFRIIEDLTEGLAAWMDEAGYRTLDDVRGKALPNVVKWEDLDLNYHLVAEIDQDACIGCELCWVACEDGAHQAIRRLGTGDGGRGTGGPVVEIIEEACVAFPHGHVGEERHRLQPLLRGVPGARVHHDAAGSQRRRTGHLEGLRRRERKAGTALSGALPITGTENRAPE